MKNTVGDTQKPKRTGRILFFLFFAFVIGLTIFIMRGPYISTALKKIILPELEAASGHRVTAQRIYINIFPLFIGANDLRVIDEDGNRIVFADKVKGYIELPGLLSRHLSIQRLVIKGPEISTNRKQLDEILKNVKAYLGKETGAIFKVKIEVVEVTNGIAYLRDDENKGTLEMKGFSGEVIIGRNQRLQASIKELGIEKAGWPKIRCDVNTSVLLKSDGIEIKHLEIGSYGSRFKGEGVYSKGKGTLRTEISLIVDSVKRFLNLRQKGEGRISAKGEIVLEGIQHSSASDEFNGQLLKNIFVNLKLNGNFYIQTLMEVLKVKEKMEGLVDFQGKIGGHLSDISGKAKVRLRNGNLFGVDIDSLMCEILYKDGVMHFEKGRASLYNGTAEAQATIHLPVVDYFTVGVQFQSVDSGAALRLIGWDPGIPAGKVEGELVTSGKVFNPDGWFAYTSLSGEKRSWVKTVQHSADNVLDRIRTIKGNYSFRNDIISFSNLQLSTLVSNLYLKGAVDIANRSINLKSRLSTNDVLDLSKPYYVGAKGQGGFLGKVTGSFDNPEISGRATFSDASVEGYRVENIIIDFLYKKNLLDVRKSLFRSHSEAHALKGKIVFPEAKKIFDLSMPVYNLTASFKNADFEDTVQIFYKDFSAKGRLNADIEIGGKGKDISISGNAHVKNAAVYEISFDTASAFFSFTNGELSFKNVKVIKGLSVLIAKGNLSPDGKFSYRASSEKLLVKDIGIDRIPDDLAFTMQSEGYGTFENPTITLSAKVVSGTFKGENMGGGIVTASVQNRKILLNAALFNGKMKLTGSGHLDDTLPWNAELYIQPARYDFLVSSILKDVPEDLQLTLEGQVRMEGDRKNITASADINHFTLSLFDQTLSNDSHIRFVVHNKKLSLKAFTVKSGSASFRLQGGVEIGQEYDVSIEGSSSLSPLKGLSKKIGYLKGDAEFAFSIKGKWDSPEINGGMSVTDAAFGLRDYPMYISSINGYLYMDGNRIVLRNLSGKIGGGSVTFSGHVNLTGFSMKGFYVEANLDNITTTISKDFTANFGGNLLYKGTKDSQSIIGDIKINRGRYKKTIEWRSWLLETRAKEIPRTEVSAFEQTELNIRISASDYIYIDTNIARAPVQIRGDMIVKGTIANPVLLGRLESTEGYVYFRNNEFRIIYASADFANPNRIMPILNFTAETLVQGYSIRLTLEGQIDHFTLALSSDPHLEEVDILALLTVGQVGKQLKGLEGGISAGEATSFLTGKMQDVLEERLKMLTGLDRFQVDSYVSKTTSTVIPRVTVAKRLVNDRLFVTYTTSLGLTEEQIIKLEYLLSKKVSLIGMRDERGSIGGDVKFRFEFK